MNLANAEYVSGGVFGSDGKLYYNFYVITVDTDTYNQLQFPVNYIPIPVGTSTEDLQTLLSDAIREEAVNQGTTIDEGKLTMPVFVQA